MKFNGNKLKAMRKELGLKQIQLAEKLGTFPAVLCQWEKGKYVPSAVNILSLGRFFNVDPSIFFEDASVTCNTAKEE